MTKAPLSGGKTGPNPTDRGKRGTKRSLLTEAAGIPVGLVVDGADRNDFKLARATLESLAIARSEPTADDPQGLCPDKGYEYPEVHELAVESHSTAQIRARGEEVQALKREAGYRAAGLPG